MEITKTHLESKLKKFTEDHKIAETNMNNYAVLMRKLEGAIEATQLLLNELKPEEKTEPEKKLAKK